jgi:hypothetical protein
MPHRFRLVTGYFPNDYDSVVIPNDHHYKKHRETHMSIDLVPPDILQSAMDTLTNLLSPHGPAAAAGGLKTYAPGDFSIHFFLQLAVIIVTCRVVGWLGQKLLGQPQVVGEMIAGVVLGPSLLGLFFPDIQAAIFPKETRNVLYTGAQFGVGLYMFMVGTSIRGDHFKQKGGSAFAVSLAGIAAPALIAILITPFLLRVPGLFAANIEVGPATLFMGACIALTAFPMLARIINERPGQLVARHPVIDGGGV